jgi:iron complex transport system ATP-binding protein
MLKVVHVSGGYEDKQIVNDVSFSVKKGRMLGILGPNGSGKSTLLKMISGTLPVMHGDIYIDGQLQKTYKQKALARKMAVLPQLHAHAFSHTVRETVALGRYPHQTGLFSQWSEADETATEQAMHQTGVAQYRDTSLDYLSGGEQQRTFIAQALAQQAEILLLDEPTNHLDLEHQRQMMDMLKAEVVARGLTVVSVFHDMNLAALYCDELLLLENGHVRAYGAPAEVLTEDEIADVYHTCVAKFAHPHLATPQMALVPDIPSLPSHVTLEQFTIKDEFVHLQTTAPLRTLSSAMHNPGFGWFRHFVNRSVDATYMAADAHAEMKRYIEQQQLPIAQTVAMMTAVDAKHAVIRRYTDEDADIFVMVTAGIGNAVDAARGHLHEELQTVGTINLWVIVNGHLTDESFMQATMTAVEAKVKAMHDDGIRDRYTDTLATGTSTDSILVAATQSGPRYEYAGTITSLGKLIGRGVYECMHIALDDYKRANGWPL